MERTSAGAKPRPATEVSGWGFWSGSDESTKARITVVRNRENISVMGPDQAWIAPTDGASIFVNRLDVDHYTLTSLIRPGEIVFQPDSVADFESVIWPPPKTTDPRIVRLVWIWGGVVTALVLGGLIAWAAIFGPPGGGNPNLDIDMRYEVVNPAALRIDVTATNKGDRPGTFKCTVRASDPSGAFSGFDIVSNNDDPVPVGKTRTYTGSIIITNEGAAFVTDVTFDC